MTHRLPLSLLLALPCPSPSPAMWALSLWVRNQLSTCTGPLLLPIGARGDTDQGEWLGPTVRQEPRPIGWFMRIVTRRRCGDR
jgi:hypothetical protein